MGIFNNELKERAIRRAKQSAKEHEKKVEIVTDKSTELFNVRIHSKEEIIIPVENFINKLANSPKNFEKSFEKLKLEYQNFKNEIHRLEIEAKDANFTAGSVAAGGVAVGVGAAALLPTGAMAVATTFGVASTGTAIATLSGAAATNAALAWLGGGALIAGGGGMAAGSALLALAGPIGWGIAGAGLIGGGVFAASKNKEIAEKANSERYKIEKGIKRIEIGIVQINKIIELTNKHNTGVKQLLNILEMYAPKDFKNYSVEQKHMLGALINHIESLSKLLKKKVKVD